MQELKQYIREIEDFPKPGILYYDITTLLQIPAAFHQAIAGMEAYVSSRKPAKIAAIESRGYLFGAVLAHRLALPLVLIRKPGKLPHKTITQTYDLEYGSNVLEIHVDAIAQGDRVVIVDDLLASGGTIEASIKLIEQLGGTVQGISCLIGLTFLPFQQRLAGYDLNYLIHY